MKQQMLEEAAKKELISSYAIVTEGELVYQRQAMLNMFRKGVEWQANQSPWISVKERLPEKPKHDWVLVVVRDKRDGFISIPQIGELRGDGFWHTVTSDSFNTQDFRLIYKTTDVLGEFLKQEVICWMPIPSFDEILEANRDVLERIKEKEVRHG
ncbi:DUF551 domain-containing protein [Bacteroides thetaiotaomicron]|uniref:DUF551 domain-containing protein n=1 Tax=Bacteroides thetaiotaomicron TaxID=818 RepID=UPI0018A15E43|nr:DUF551 domain-containing protein [Bacteroides thetaiotaomicron]MDC2233535.1 DUF551 domain-containing protein [Bacteroides thetaiotaomicron]